MARHLSSAYVQHNPTLADGTDALREFGAGAFAQTPGLSLESKRAVAEGDQVWLHGHLRMGPDDPGSAVADVYRFDDEGRIAEHWDVLQPVPANSKNDNTTF